LKYQIKKLWFYFIFQICLEKNGKEGLCSPLAEKMQHKAVTTHVLLIDFRFSSFLLLHVKGTVAPD